jgi:hypothetical protein
MSHTSRFVACALVSGLAAPAFAAPTDVTPAVRASIHDQPQDGTGDTFNAAPFEGLLRRIDPTQEDRAIEEYDVAAFAGQTIGSAVIAGRVAVNNAFDVGPRSFEFRLYAGNGAADLLDFATTSVVVGTGAYHPPGQTSFTYAIDVTSEVAALMSGGATWIGVRVQCTSTPNFPNVLDATQSRLSIDVVPTSGTGLCFGDGSGTACPCGNASAPGANAGCLSSLALGATLRADGNASVSSDSLVLRGAQMPNSSALYFQGTSELSGGGGAAFGDGLRCAGGTVIRLGTKTNVAGASQYPAAGDAAVSVRGLLPAGGGTRSYQIWYRNAAAFCTPSTFNLSNGWSVAWGA